ELSASISREEIDAHDLPPLVEVHHRLTQFAKVLVDHLQALRTLRRGIAQG
ncbi:hypothetical protein SARC_18205, partial [Sphaeroforma arctica JP610]